MKKNILIVIVLFFITISNAQTVQKVRKVVSILPQQTFYLNGGMKATFGGKSRTYYRIDLPQNTVSWYYTLTTKEGQSNTAALNLVAQLTRFYDPTGFTALAVNVIGTPSGAAACDIFLMDRTNADAFLAKVDYLGSYQYIQSGSRENYRNGVIEVRDIRSGSCYLGFKNPSPSTGISISFEVAAIIEENVYNNTEWANTTKERINNDLQKYLILQFLDGEASKIVANCTVDKITKNKTPESYDAMTIDEREKFVQEAIESCSKNAVGINSPESEKAVTYGNLGWKAYENGDIEKCIEYSKKALTFDNSQGYIKSNLGLCYLIKGDESTAMDFYIESLSDIKKVKLTSKIKEYLQMTIDDINSALTKNPMIKGCKEIKSLFQDELNNY